MVSALSFHQFFDMLVGLQEGHAPCKNPVPLIPKFSVLEPVEEETGGTR